MQATFATRTWYSEYVVTDEDVAKQVDAARRERVGSHGISKAVVRSSVLCDRFSSGGLGQIVRFAYKIQRQSPCRETDLMTLTLCLLGYRGGNTW